MTATSWSWLALTKKLFLHSTLFCNRKSCFAIVSRWVKLNFWSVKWLGMCKVQSRTRHVLSFFCEHTFEFVPGSSVYNVSTMFKNLNVISSENNPLENAPYASWCCFYIQEQKASFNNPILFSIEFGTGAWKISTAMTKTEETIFNVGKWFCEKTFVLYCFLSYMNS